MKSFSKEAVWGKIIETLMRLELVFDESPIEVGETVPSGEVLVRVYFDKLSSNTEDANKILKEIEIDLKKEFGWISHRDQFWFRDRTKYLFIKPPKA